MIFDHSLNPYSTLCPNYKTAVRRASGSDNVTRPRVPGGAAFVTGTSPNIFAEKLFFNARR